MLDVTERLSVLSGLKDKDPDFTTDKLVQKFEFWLIIRYDFCENFEWILRQNQIWHQLVQKSPK